MLFIQDPSYKNSMYLHETLLSECVNSVKGGGAYAFATKDGINMLLTDENFKIFLTKGVYTLIVGTDDITNEHAVNALIELKQKYGKHLVVKAYIHKNKGSTFHPKFSWFQKKDGGSLVLGSGNLTQKGLRHNREAYSVIQHTTDEMEKVVAEWEEWYTHSAPFLFDIDDPIVMLRAKQNTEQTRAVSEAKASVRKEIAHSQANDELANVYENQPQDPKRVKIATPKKTSNVSVKKEQEGPTTQVVITDEDVDIDASYWSITDESDVLIAEIPKSGDRWKQANFDKNTFENYFGARMYSVIPFQLAYAVSIHKAQGLEYDSVKVIIPKSNSEKITHGIFYTAITRAKKKLKIYWSSEIMEEIVESFKQEDTTQRSLEIIRKKLNLQ